MGQTRWKDIMGYEGRYRISKRGIVKSLITNKILAVRYNTKRYVHVALYDNSGHRRDWMTHRLVAKHFLDRPVGKDFVNHLDFDKENNCVTNLEWVTIPENNKHYFKNRRIQ